MAAGRVYDWIHDVWYGGSAAYRLLLPLAGLYWLLLGVRRALYRAGLLRRHHVGVPVVVVGNITAGGTGKTPTTIWLAQELTARGFSVGIVSRGYGGSRTSTAMRVDAASDPAVVGDEPVLLAKRSACPVIVDRDRVRAARLLVAGGVDVIIADDGLQHYALERSYEICVIDAARGLGNRCLLPAGPLREPIARLAEVDQVLVNGHAGETDPWQSVVEQNAIEFRLAAHEVRRVDESRTVALAEFAGRTVHAAAAIGNPRRFFEMLQDAGMQVIEHPFPDHARLARKDIDFGDDFDILMTEKDAVKLDRKVANKYWYVPVELTMDPADARPWLEQIESRLREELGRR